MTSACVQIGTSWIPGVNKHGVGGDLIDLNNGELRDVSKALLFS